MEGETRQQRRVRRLRETIRSSDVRAAILAALDGRGEATGEELRAAVPGNPSLGTVNYHLKLLQEAETVGCVGGRYRLAGGTA
jgi:predicted transcriptional regulator